MAQRNLNQMNVEIGCDIPKDLPNFVCIEYPGKINNIDNAVKTLGGNDQIQQTFVKYNRFQQNVKNRPKKSQTTPKTTNIPKEPYLELHLNPDGVFDHALFGKINPVKNCILIKKTTKIRKKKSRKRKHDEISDSTEIDNNHNHNHNQTEAAKSPPQSKIEVLGRVTSLVTYDELADFQVFSDLKYPKKIINENSPNSNYKESALETNQNSNTNLIKKRDKRRKLWSLREDDIPNISQYPLVPRVFAAKAVAIDNFIKHQGSKSSKSDQKSLETSTTRLLSEELAYPTKAKNQQFG